MYKIYIWIFLVLVAQKTTSTSINATVELAIFCDFDFTEHFHHNETKVREYWAIRMYDANLRFKTLPSVNINFVVTSLTTVKSKEEQGFIEARRDNNGKVAIEDVLRAFPIWVNSQHRSRIPGYDIALLALGADTNDNYKSRAFVNAACDYNHAFAAVRFEKDNWWSSCGPLEFGLSTVLGSWADSDYSSECHNSKYIKGRECSKNHFFFSDCTNNAIRNTIKLASCLHRNDSSVANIFTVKELNVQPPSIREQCILITNMSNIWVNVSDENSCFSTICYSGSKENPNAEKIIYPVDNSPCDNDKSCFRGRCIQNGFQIQYAESSKCLHSTNPFRSDDSLRVINCPDVPTALHRFIIFEKENNTVYLATPYTSINGSEKSDKCVSYISSLNIIQFQNCYHPNQTSKLSWELLHSETESNQFLIRQKGSQNCLGLSPSESLQMRYCNSDDKSILWKFGETWKPNTNMFFKEFTTSMPTEVNRLTTIMTYHRSGATLNNSSVQSSLWNNIINNTSVNAVLKENSQTKNIACYGLWNYLVISILLLVTIILVIIILKLYKRNKEIILGQLLTQDFHELSRIIATENFNTIVH